MFFYQAKVDIKAEKLNEFVECVVSLSTKFRKEEGCLDFNLYKDIENENSYSVVGGWGTKLSMDKHFKSKDFKVLIGAAKVLGKNFEIYVGNAPEKGSFELAREKIALPTEEL